ncbi:2OG-Fe(II) oxygenase superfamily protein [Sodiomyces alkalinus F11]|uniref:2OG-Fe(II) oxygenase superfamily protein n=1 Tax=Sodiomyces alkalinus (strain CBS 110278 / VKM F-3762 / F11) TaxID=1314773 RepID=A0A3N2Q8L9_SODAK|nr:2OG-Fe(II) oxygenase superfamily protein [Sodiomyces alkalinus F11]ROT43076.1 2OG-Fe(II) oxygenase superfamily protein [Sodiomyces alkalinus F11]
MPDANIPIIDISNSGTDEASVARHLVDAAVEHGFIYIRNTGGLINPSDIGGIFDLSRKLFKAPVEEKAACSIQTNNRGWSGMHTETLDPKTQKIGDFKEAFNFGEFRDGKAQQPLPKTIQPDEPQINAFREQCHSLCLRLLDLLGLGLDVHPPDFFSSAHLTRLGESGTILRFLHYPEGPSADTAQVRAGAHSDYGSVTLLFRLPGQPGLEILTRENEWAPVPVCPPGTESDPAPPILINIGDLLSYWTNGLLRSTVHRVVFSDQSQVQGETDTGPRYSIAYFCHPRGTVTLDPVPSERVRNFVPDAGTGDANPYSERKVLTADEHLQMRLKASYLSLYEKQELQK